MNLKNGQKNNFEPASGFINKLHYFEQRDFLLVIQAK